MHINKARLAELSAA